ncbi:MAG: hypothetical protein AB8B87_17370 [Granulosicoccus sp.]
MKKNTLIDAHPDDEDIAQLITAQSVNVPDHLRQSILQNAALECEQDNNVKKIKAHRPVDAHPAATRGWTRGLGIAATFLIAAILTPMMLKSPESELDSYDTDSLTRADAEISQSAVSALQATDAEEMEQLAEVATEQSDIVAVDSDAITMSSRLTQSREIGRLTSGVEANKSLKADQTVDSQPQLSASPMTRENTFNSAPTLSYRESAEKWINEIKVLIVNGDTQKARDEYSLFEQRHPAEAKRFKPDFDRQAIDDPAPTEHRSSK